VDGYPYKRRYITYNSSKSQSHAAKQEFFAQLDAKVAQAIGLEGL
jgi:hypothetical protein